MSFERYIYKIIKYAMGVMLSIILVLLLFFENTDYYCKSYLKPQNWICICIILSAILFWSIISYICRNKNTNIAIHRTINIDKFINAVTVLLFVGQVYVFYNIFFLTGWDAANVRNLGVLIEAGDVEGVSRFQNYYSMYPNNMLITFISAIILKINKMIGVFTGEYETMSCVVINCFINSCVCNLTYRTAKIFVAKKWAAICFGLTVLSVGISPWSVIFYSDSVGLMFPVLCFYLYYKPVSGKIATYVLRVLAMMVGVIGYFIKPQSFIILIAIIIIEVVHLFTEFKIRKLSRLVLLISVCLLCFCGVKCLINKATYRIGLEIDETKTLSWTHFLMMGANESRGGVYSEDDVVYSKSFTDPTERKNANITRTLERLQSMGFMGWVKHSCKKMLTTFNDGTFAWGMEGKFYFQEPENRNSYIAPKLKSFYYNHGQNSKWFFAIEQIVWIAILLFSTIACWGKIAKGQEQKMSALLLALGGLIVYELLFEVRARYLYTYIPLFCLLALVGMQNVKNVLKETRINKI